MKKNRIEKVWIEENVDEYPDTSLMGKYTDNKSDWVICRRCGEYIIDVEKANERQEEIDEELDSLEDETNCEFESKENQEKIASLKKERYSLILHDCPKYHREYSYFKPYAKGEKEGTEEYKKYGKQDFERMEGLNNNNWYFMGIIAKAEIVTANNTIQIIRSGGLWGIESDSDQEYLDNIKKDELANLKEELKSLGFGVRAINKAFQNVEDNN